MGAALLALSAALTFAQVPPVAPPKPVDPFESGQIKPLPLEPVLLKRWGFDVDKVLGLAPAQRLELQKELTLLEIGRLRRLELLRKIRPADWQGFIDADEKLTPDGMKLVDDYLAQLGQKPMLVPAQVSDLARKDGKPLTPEDRARLAKVLDQMFDGVAGRADVAELGHDVVVDAHVRNETIYSLTVTNPKSGFSVEIGQLYVDGAHPQTTNSPYVNLMGAWDSKPDSWVDYRFKMSFGFVDLHSSWFSDRGGAPQVNQLMSLGQGLGVPQSALGDAARYLSYDDPYKAHGLIVTSLLGEIGRAYNLYGPLDLVWTAGHLTKIAWVAPNTAFDETLGLRVRLNKDLSFGIFGGVDENLSPVANNLMQQAVQYGTIKPGLYLETAPHASAALWGKVPGVSDLSFSVSATERLNQTTTVHQGEVSLMTTFLDHPIALRGDVSFERGRSIEFNREQARAQLDYQISQHISAYLAYQRDHVKYGNANVNSDAVLIGIEGTFGGPDSRVAGSLAVDQLLGGRYKGQADPMRPYLQETLNKVNRDLVAGLNAADAANNFYQSIRGEISPGQLESQLNSLSLALQRLDPSTANQLINELSKAKLSDAQTQFLSNLWLRTVSQGGGYYTQLSNQLARQLGGNNLGSDLFWAQSQAAAKLQQTLGITLSAGQQQQLANFFGGVANQIQNGAQLTPQQIQRIDDQGVALIQQLGTRLTQAERQAAINQITQQARDLGSLIQANEAKIAAGAGRVLQKIDNVSQYYAQHRGEIRELVALLTNEQVWDAVVIQAARTQLIEGMNKIGKVNVKVPVLGDINLQIDAPAVLAATNILGSRLSPIAPVKAQDIDKLLLTQGAKSLGLPETATDQQFVAALFGVADRQIQQQLTQQLTPLLNQAAADYNPTQLGQKIIAAVPPAAAQYLQQQYGANLQNLLPAHLDTPKLNTLLTQTLPTELTNYLEKKYGAQIAQGLSAATSWAGELLSRQLNMMLIQTMLAAEELNRLSVDHGRKIDDLDLRFAMRSLDMLTERERMQYRDRLQDVTRKVAETSADQESKIVDRVTAQGRLELQTLQLDPAWPAGLRVSVDDKSLAAILAYYGDGGFFGLLDRIRTVYLAKPRPGGANVTFVFDDKGLASIGGVAIRKTKGSSDVQYELARPKDARDADFKLSLLERYLDD